VNFDHCCLDLHSEDAISDLTDLDPVPRVERREIARLA